MEIRRANINDLKRIQELNNELFELELMDIQLIDLGE